MQLAFGCCLASCSFAELIYYWIEKLNFNEDMLYLMMMNLDKLLNSKKIILNEKNVENIVFTCMVITQKYYEDEIFSDKDYSKLKNIDYDDLINMQMDFLETINYSLLINKDDLEQYKTINESIEAIEDIGRADGEDYKKIINSLFENALIHDDMLQLFFDVCSEMELNEVRNLYIKIFTSILNKFKEGTDFGQTRFLEINKEATEEIPLLCICLLGQESIPLDNPQPDNNKNRRKKNSFESYFYERTLIMPCVSDKIKIIKINKNFKKSILD